MKILKRIGNTMDKASKVLIIVAILMMAISFFTVYFSTPGNIDRIDTVFTTDTFLKRDTLDTVIYKTIPTYIEKIKIDTVFDKNGDTLQLITENKVYQDTLCNEKDSIILQSFITGINSRRDSLKANWKKQETIITNTVTIEKYIEKKKTFWNRLHIGLQTGYGYTFDSKTLQPYVGAGISIDIN